MQIADLKLLFVAGFPTSMDFQMFGSKILFGSRKEPRSRYV